jgi:hypothetical protein
VVVLAGSAVCVGGVDRTVAIIINAIVALQWAGGFNLTILTTQTIWVETIHPAITVIVFAIAAGAAWRA